MPLMIGSRRRLLAALLGQLDGEVDGALRRAAGLGRRRPAVVGAADPPEGGLHAENATTAPAASTPMFLSFIQNSS